MGVRSVLRFPVWDRGRRSLFRLTTGTLGEAQRGHVALSGSFSAIGSSSLFAVAFTGTPSSFRHRKAFVLDTRGVAPVKWTPLSRPKKCRPKLQSWTAPLSNVSDPRPCSWAFFFPPHSLHRG